MSTLFLFAALFPAATGVTISEPAQGGSYDGDWLTLRAIVENEDLLPDSVVYSLNGQSTVPVPRLNTDWPTYMQNYRNQGYSPSPGPETAEVLWTAPVCGYSHEFCNPTTAYGKVFYASDEYSTAYGFDAATGEELWSYDVVNYVDDAITWDQGRVYIPADSLWCLDAATGDRLWAWKDPGALYVSGSPVVAGGHCFAAMNDPASDSCLVVSLNAENGETEWTMSMEGHFENCMAFQNDTLFFGLATGYMSSGIPSLFALDAGNGDVIWSNAHTDEGYWDSSPTLYQGLLYIGGFDGFIHAFDPSDGSLVWEEKIHPEGDFIGVEPTAAVHDGALFTGCSFYGYGDRGAVACYGTETGNLIWSIMDQIEVHGSIGLSDELAYLGGHRADTMYALDQSTGSVVWEFGFPGSQQKGVQSTPSITDGVMYIAATNGYLYAFGTGLKYSYLGDLYAQVGSNQLIVTSWSGGAAVAADTVSFTVTGTGLTGPSISGFCLSVSPNPIRSSASVSFSIIEPGHASVVIYDLSGRTVRTLADGEMNRGTHSLSWDCCDSSGQRAPAGVYLCRISSGGMEQTSGVCVVR